MDAISKLVEAMSLKEKIGQLNLVSYREEILEQVKAGEIGAVLNVHNNQDAKKLQDAALLSAHKIPVLIGNDVIHGYRTTFPVPVSEACSFNLELIEKSAHYSMIEAKETGINWIYAPMLDLTNDPRWGRIMETSGEDPYLNSVIGQSRIKGIQTEHEGRITAACGKHYLGYGAVEAGLDYATSDFSESKMRNYYLPPFKKAVEAGVMSIMTAFTTFNELPVTMNKYLLEDVLRNECGFQGVIVSDWQAIKQLVNFKIASSESEAAKLAFAAGVDMDLHSKLYIKYLEEILEENPDFKKKLDEAVYRVLKMKKKMGLFADPFPKENSPTFKQMIRKQAKKSADESVVLLKNDNQLLPLAVDAKILVTGPFINERDLHLGAWSCQGRAEDVVNLKEGLENRFTNLEFYETPLETEKTNWEELKTKARNKDVIVLALGEMRSLSGENNCRLKLDLPNNQDLLVEFLEKINIPLVAVISAGRPLLIAELEKKVDAILWNFHLGVEAGNSLAACLLGEVNPSGKITLSFPKEFGQIPIYYNRYPYGRPDIVHYLDGDLEPLYPFGYGLSYSKFNFENVEISFQAGFIKVTLEIENVSEIDGKEVVQIYLVPDLMNKLLPEKQLIAFKKIEVKAKSKVKLELETKIDLGNYRRGVSIMVGISSLAGITKYFSFD